MIKKILAPFGFLICSTAFGLVVGDISIQVKVTSEDIEKIKVVSGKNSLNIPKTCISKREQLEKTREELIYIKGKCVDDFNTEK